MTAVTRVVRLADVELDVVLRRPQAEPTVFLLHGCPQTALMWERLATALVIEGCQTVAPCQRGYDRSSSPRCVDEYYINRLAADVRALALALGHECYTVIGHDWGAAVGWWLARHPDGRINGLIAISAPHPAIWRQATVDVHDHRKMSRYARFFRISLLPEALIRLTGYAGFERAVVDAGASKAERASCRKSWRTGGNLSAMLNWYRALLWRSFVGQINITMQTLFIYGRQDRFLSVSAGRRTAAIGASTKTVVLEGEHWLVDRSALVVRQLVLDFLERRTRAGAVNEQ